MAQAAEAIAQGLVREEEPDKKRANKKSSKYGKKKAAPPPPPSSATPSLHKLVLKLSTISDDELLDKYELVRLPH